MSESTENPKSRLSRRKTMLLVLLALVIVAPVFALVLLGMGQVSGVEFSPDDFSRRRFSYNQLPIVKWVVFKKTFDDETTQIEESLVKQKFITPIVKKKKVWHLVSESGVQLPSAECDARFLTGYLDLLDEDRNNYWDTWNTEYPDSAAIFWPQIAELARDEMYLKVADVMRTAMAVTQDKPDDLRESLDKTLAKAYLDLGSLDFELGNTERSRYRLRRSIELSPSKEAYIQRSKLLEELGLDDESQSDLEKAKSVDSINFAGDK